MSFNASPKYTDGTFMTYDEAVGSLDLTKYNDGKPLRTSDSGLWTPSNKDSAGLVQTIYDNGSEILWLSD